jgi:hypothetical protein
MIVESTTVDDGSAVVGLGIVGGEQFGGGASKAHDRRLPRR